MDTPPRGEKEHGHPSIYRWRFEVDPGLPTRSCERGRSNSGGRDSGLLGVRPVVPFVSIEDPNRLAYQYLLVEVQGAKTTTLVLWASILALTVVVSGSYWIALGLAVFAGPMQAAVAFFSPVAFVSNRGRDNSSDRAILLGDSPCEGSAR